MNEETTTVTDELITLTIRKRHAYGAVALIAGFALGYVVGSTRDDASAAPPSRAEAPAGREPGEAPVPETGEPSEELLAELEGENRPSRGPEDAAVVLVEFTDYQCPFCQRHFRQTYPELIREYGDELRYVVRNFPVPSLHRFAQTAAEAAECAYLQKKFWPFHDALFRNSSDLSPESIEGYAADVGLDVDSFRQCLESGRTKDIVARDQAVARSHGVSGTPTFFLNGERIVGAQPLDAFRSRIESALASR